MFHETADISLDSKLPSTQPSSANAAPDDPQLREVLKRCPESAYCAAVRFRKTGDVRQLSLIIFGIIARFAEPDLRPKLVDPPPTLRLIEDLGIDSLTMMEIIMLVEEVLTITIKNEELRELHTLGEIQQFIERKLSKPTMAP